MGFLHHYNYTDSYHIYRAKRGSLEKFPRKMCLSELISLKIVIKLERIKGSYRRQIDFLCPEWT